MASHVERDSGAAMRRRERRLRSWAKHERQTVGMALAEALHHSAPRRPKTARAGVRPGVLEDPGPRRETEHEQHAAPQGPKLPSPGEPSLAVPLLAGTAGEVVDARTLSFLLAVGFREEERGGEEGEEDVVARGSCSDVGAGASLGGAGGQEEKEEEEEAAQGFLLSILVCLSRCSHPFLWTFLYAPLISGGLVRCHGVA